MRLTPFKQQQRRRRHQRQQHCIDAVDGRCVRETCVSSSRFGMGRRPFPLCLCACKIYTYHVYACMFRNKQQWGMQRSLSAHVLECTNVVAIAYIVIHVWTQHIVSIQAAGARRHKGACVRSLCATRFGSRTCLAHVCYCVVKGQSGTDWHLMRGFNKCCSLHSAAQLQLNLLQHIIGMNQSKVNVYDK